MIYFFSPHEIHLVSQYTGLSWKTEHTGLLCSEHKSDLFFPLSVTFCRLDHIFPEHFFRQMIPKLCCQVLVNPRLCLTEAKSEIEEKISGGVPNDLCKIYFAFHYPALIFLVIISINIPSLNLPFSGAILIPCQYAELGTKGSSRRDWTYFICILDWLSNLTKIINNQTKSLLWSFA